ncbi:MAG: hypothetical protein NC218_01950 [Acetobacter sp.]|nr:hypothetical protein [Acetobacter sp.]
MLEIKLRGGWTCEYCGNRVHEIDVESTMVLSAPVNKEQPGTFYVRCPLCGRMYQAKWIMPKENK